jgi:hypothetical protein
MVCRGGYRGEAKMATDLRLVFRFESAVTVTAGELSNNGKSLYNEINALRAALGRSQDSARSCAQPTLWQGQTASFLIASPDHLAEARCLGRVPAQ